MPTLRQSLAARILHLYPLMSGCGTLANHPFLHRMVGRSEEVVWSRIAGGMHVCTPLDDYIGRSVFYMGDLDPKITWICSRLLREGDVALDIGANLGIVTFLMARLVGPSGHVHAFEPNPLLQEFIQQAIERNSAANVTLHPVALGERDDELSLRVPRGNAGAASLVEPRVDIAVHEVPVPVRRLGDVLADSPPAAIRLVKMDVEGFEPAVLRGAVDLFRSTPPEAIIFELNERDVSLRNHPTFRILDELGYAFFAIPRCLVRMRLVRFDPWSSSSPRAHDFLASPRGELYERVAELVRA